MQLHVVDPTLPEPSKDTAVITMEPIQVTAPKPSDNTAQIVFPLIALGVLLFMASR